MYAKGVIILLCVLVAISDGERKINCIFQPKTCPKTLKPLCGTNGVTYQNQCFLCDAFRTSWRRIIKIKKIGRC